MAVMVISCPADLHALAVMEALTAQGVTVEMLDLSEFPTQLSLSMEFDGPGRRYVIRRSDGAKLDLSTIGAVWWRRPQQFRFPESLSNQTHRRFAMAEAHTAFQGFFQSVDAFWVNDPVRDSAAHDKPRQLALAPQVGLTIPPTLMTSDPDEARDFWKRFDGCVIYKTFASIPEVWRETRRLKPEEMALAENVRTTLVIFQRYVEAVADIRVTIIGDEVFAAATDVRQGEYPVDFRFNADARFQAHALPAEVEDALRLLMRRMGLEYGAIDLRLTPEGNYVFLEINPAGQFLWIEIATGQKITAALAAHLANGAGKMLQRRDGTPSPISELPSSIPSLA